MARSLRLRHTKDGRGKVIDDARRRKAHRHFNSSRSTRIIHVHVRSLPSPKSTFKTVRDPTEPSRTINQTETLASPKWISNHGAHTQTYGYSTSSDHRNVIRTSHNSDQLRKQNDIWATTMDYSKKNRKKKFKCSPRLILTVAIALLLILIALGVLLVLLLVRPIAKTPSERIVALRWNTTGITIAGRTRISGNATDLLNSPWGLVINGDYSLYVADRQNHRIQKYGRGSSVAVTVAGSANGIRGTDNASLFGPSTIVIDRDENVYVTVEFEI